MPAKKHVVVFDFDGVIADSFALHMKSWRKVLKDYGASLPDDAVRKGMGWSSIDTARVLVKEAGIAVEPEEVSARKSDVFRERAEAEMNLTAGAAEAIGRLKDEFCVAVTAGRHRDLVEDSLNRFGIRDQLDLVLTNDDVTEKDELDDLLTLVFTRLEIKPAAGVMVDDSRNGLLAAERAGMKSVAFDSNPKFHIDYSMSDATISSLNELQPELIHSVFG